MAGGGVAGNIVAGMEIKPAPLPGEHDGIFYVAVGPTKIGFFAVKRGLFKNKLGELLVEYSRDDLQTLEIERGVMLTAHFLFQDDTHYALLCAGMNRGKLKTVQALLVPE
jgi:hypothetical protein